MALESDSSAVLKRAASDANPSAVSECKRAAQTLALMAINQTLDQFLACDEVLPAEDWPEPRQRVTIENGRVKRPRYPQYDPQIFDNVLLEGDWSCKVRKFVR